MADMFCGIDDSTYTQLDCGNEPGRIVAMALIDRDTPSPSTADLESTAWWTAKTSTSPPTAFIVNQTRGEYPGGSPTEEEGYGTEGPRVTGAEHEFTVMVQGMIDNRDFWEDKNRRRYKMAFVMSNEFLYFVDYPCTVYGTPEITSDLNEGQKWKVVIKYKNLSNPAIVNMPSSVFDLS